MIDPSFKVFLTVHQDSQRQFRASWNLSRCSLAMGLLFCVLLLTLPNRGFAKDLPQQQQSHLVRSDSMQKDIAVEVWLPSSYGRDNGQSQRRYPVLYLLHGWSSNPKEWSQFVPELSALVDRHEVIVVSPDGNYNSWYIDSPLDTKSRYATFTAVELVNWVDASFNTDNRRNARAITGASMGGYGAFYLASHYADTFGAVGSMSGAMDLRPFYGKWQLHFLLGNIDQTPQLWDEFSVLPHTEWFKDKQLAIIFDCGDGDFFLDVNRALHDKFLEIGVDHVYHEAPGGHEWSYWQGALPRQFDFFSRYFNGSVN